MTPVTRPRDATPPAQARDQLRTLVAATDSRTRRRLLLVAGALLLLLVGAVVAKLFAGLPEAVDRSQVIPAALGLREGMIERMVLFNRLPRAVVAVVAGGLFGLSGAIYQRLLGNPLATPDIIGITAGASACAVIVLSLELRIAGLLQVAAATGAVVAALLVFALSWRGGVNTYRLVLVGIGVGAMFAAVTSYLLVRMDERGGEVAMRWLVGSLNGAAWGDARLLGAALVLACLGTVALLRHLRAIALGDDVAEGLGTRVNTYRVLALVLGALAAAAATSVVGPIAFVGLISGPMATRLLGVTDAPFSAALVGAVTLVSADVASQSMPLVSPVPTGAIIAVFGAPVLIYLLLRGRG